MPAVLHGVVSLAAIVSRLAGGKPGDRGSGGGLDVHAVGQGFLILWSGVEGVGGDHVATCREIVGRLELAALWYALGMTKKIAISLPDESLEKVKAAVSAGKAPSVSNYITHLIEDANAKESFSEMIAEWLRDSGASKQELRAAEEESRLAFDRAGLTNRGGRRGQTSKKAS
jgi:Arc/MetJ-type ribon-helix-helix transcriptional regulator